MKDLVETVAGLFVLLVIFIALIRAGIFLLPILFGILGAVNSNDYHRGECTVKAQQTKTNR